MRRLDQILFGEHLRETHPCQKRVQGDISANNNPKKLETFKGFSASFGPTYPAMGLLKTQPIK